MKILPQFEDEEEYEEEIEEDLLEEELINQCSCCNGCMSCLDLFYRDFM